MKKILLSFAAVGCALLANAQILLNEFYVRPNPNPTPGHHEYFELKNFGGLPENADCYTLVSYFENAAGQHGFYVVDMPALTISGRGFLTASSTAPTFVYQNGNGTADFSWNAGNINRYVYTSTGLTLNNTGAPYDNIFVKSNGTANGQGGLYAVFLFKSGVLVDALLGAHNTTVVPDCIREMGRLTHGSGCGSISYNFADVNSTPAGIIANVNAEAGTDNGYHRVGGDCSAPGTWQKASSPSEHTPGAPNPGQGNSGPSASQMLQADAMCIDNVTVQYDITAGGNSLFPVTVSLYYDANGSQFLDSGDVFIGSQVDQSVNDPAKTFTHPSGQEDFIFVFDAQGGCYDTMMPLNCPAAIILPVTWKSFTAGRPDANNVILKWTTATEVDNRGFNIQRSNGNEAWETVTFVPSKAARGNSNEELSYTFTDRNSFSGISQYRLQQIDNDGKFKYSEVRTVRGSASVGGVLIYPNPSKGMATISFNDISTSHDVFITDMSGRTIKQWRGVTDDNLKVSNLTPGVYAIRIIDQRSGAQTNDRLVVSGR
jgi:Secretion system C-terminal sorting domain